MKELQESSRSALSGIHASCRKHRAYAFAKLRLQIARLADVLTLAPALIIDIVASRDRSRQSEAFNEECRGFEERRSQLEGERDQLQADLRPGMGNPNRVGELDGLDARAQEILGRIASLTVQQATSAVEVAHMGALDSAVRIHRLVSILLELCDGCVYPQDLLSIDMAASDWVDPGGWSERFEASGGDDSDTAGSAPGLSLLHPDLLERRKQLESLEIVRKLRAAPSGDAESKQNHAANQRNGSTPGLASHVI